MLIQPALTHRTRRPLRNRLRACRSFFLTPASRLSSLTDVTADAIILDLESTVTAAEKEVAREKALEFFVAPAHDETLRILRINSQRTVHGLRDVLALRDSGARPHAIIVPKCQSAAEIQLLAELLEVGDSVIGLIPMIELARALFAADRIADAHERVCGLFLGGSDLAADLGAEGTWENLLYARSCVVAAAATVGLAAIDVPYFKGDAAGLTREAIASRRLGMTGKAALHAEELPTIDAIFTPVDDALLSMASHGRSR
jgi:citrate lyase beta subunit